MKRFKLFPAPLITLLLALTLLAPMETALADDQPASPSALTAANGSADKYEANDAMSSATGLGFPFFIDATLHSAEDVDWYSTYFTGGNALVSLVQPDSSLSYSIELYDQNGAIVARGAQDDIHATGIAAELTPGRYYVKVTGGEASARTYRLKFTKSAAASMDFSEVAMVRAECVPLSPYAYNYKNSYVGGVGIGGHYQMATAYFSRWAGPVDESIEPYPIEYRYPPDFNTREEFFAYLHTLDKYYENKPRYFLQNALWLPNWGICGKEAFIKHLKNAIYNYGAVDVTYYSSAGGTTGENSNYIYDKFSGGVNHSVTLVGWDDAIPKEKFANTQYGTPSSDGGWIMKNSWGVLSGDNGYYYISYETLSLGCTNAETVYQIDELAGQYNRQYLHDELGGLVTKELNTGEYYIKSRFTAKNSETLKAVAFASDNCDFDYEVYVNTDISKESDLGKLAASGGKTYAGYYTIKLGDGFPLQKGAQFEVTVRIKMLVGSNAALMLEYNDCVMVAVIDEDEKFFSLDGSTWNDLATYYDHKGAATVRAFTQYAGLGADFETVGSQKAKYSDPEYEAMRQKIRDEADAAAVTGASAENATASGAPAGALQTLSQVGSPQSAPDAQLPAKFDLREHGVVSPVKNQGAVGACWAFAAISAAEQAFMRNYNTVQTEGAVAIDRSSDVITLTPEAPEQIYTAKAGITLIENQGQSISWSFEGDLDSIEILNRSSRAGEAAQLFKAKKAGSVTVTASAGYANVKSASASVTIISDIPEPEIVSETHSSESGGTFSKTPVNFELLNSQPTMSNAGRLLEKHITGGSYSVYTSGSALVLSGEGGTLDIDGELDLEFMQLCGVEKITVRQTHASVDIPIGKLSDNGVSLTLRVEAETAAGAVSKTVTFDAGDLELPLTLDVKGNAGKSRLMLMRFDGVKWIEVPGGIEGLKSVNANGAISRRVVTKPLGRGIYAVMEKAEA